MTDKLFNAVKEQHDGKGRVVFLCQDPQGYYVFKPATGFKTKHWKQRNTKALENCFDRQVGCTQNNGFFIAGEAPVPGENYSLVVAKTKVKAPAPAEMLKAPMVTDAAASNTEAKNDKEAETAKNV